MRTRTQGKSEGYCHQLVRGFALGFSLNSGDLLSSVWTFLSLDLRFK